MSRRDRVVRTAAGSLLFLMVGLACESVPDIRFVADDAGGVSPDASPDATRDAGVLDGSGSQDAFTNCQGPEPEEAGVCCGRVWCVGTCDPASCTACEGKACGATEVCCAKQGGVLCKTKCP